jgi:hypothetical protein
MGVLPQKFFNIRSPECPFLPFQGEAEQQKKLYAKTIRGLRKMLPRKHLNIEI